MLPGQRREPENECTNPDTTKEGTLLRNNPHYAEMLQQRAQQSQHSEGELPLLTPHLFLCALYNYAL